MYNTKVHKLLRILEGKSFKQFEIFKITIFLYFYELLRIESRKNEVTVHGKNVFHLNKITYTCNVESNISINWA